MDSVSRSEFCKSVFFLEQQKKIVRKPRKNKEKPLIFLGLSGTFI